MIIVMNNKTYILNSSYIDGLELIRLDKIENINYENINYENKILLNIF